MKTQNESIITALKKGARLTSYSAFTRFGCVKFTTRISELRKLGYNIVANKKVSKEGKHYNEYRLEA